MHNQNDDTLLLKQIAQGDEHAFRLLFDQYRDLIFSFAWHLTESELIAKDVVQDIFMKIWTNRHTLDQIVSIRAWILRLTRNHVLNGLKRKAHESFLLGQIRASGTATGPGIEEQISYRELESMLQQAVEQLPPQQKKAYLLSRHAGLKHEEIAATLGLSAETVKKHITAALQSIKKYLASKGNLLPAFLFCFL